MLDKNGRPSLHSHDFNISHHFPIVLGIASEQRVGIDITYGDGGPQFNNDECRMLFDADPPCSQRSFLLLWAIREAYLKYTGEGFRETPLQIGPLPPTESFPDLETPGFVPAETTAENARIYCFTVRGFIGAAHCPRQALSQYVVLE